MRKKKEVPEINAASMADIAFLLLIFFLVTVTMDVDTGITRKLPPPVESEENIDIKERNIFEILVNSQNMLLVEGKAGDLITLKDEIKLFFTNPANDPNLPEKKLEQIEFMGDVFVSKGVVSLKNDRGTSYEMYIKVQNELSKAINELRDELSKERFGIAFSNLSDTAYINAVQKAIPVAISEAEPENIGGGQ